VNAPSGRRFLTTSGVVVVAAYLVAIAVTSLISGHRVLPLFEGIGPPQPYMWVNPPPEFAATNIKATAGSADFALTGPAEPDFVASHDDQCILNLAASPFPPHGSDTTVHAVVTPLDPATLGPLHFGPSVVPDGNAYQIALTYTPSGTPVTKIVSDGDVVLTTPHRADALFYSTDGMTWTKITFAPFGSPFMIGTPFKAPGYFLAGANPKVIVGSVGSTGTKSSNGTLFVVLGVVAAALILGGVSLLALRRRRRA
jgi:hypothetical protein